MYYTNRLLNTFLLLLNKRRLPCQKWQRDLLRRVSPFSFLFKQIFSTS